MYEIGPGRRRCELKPLCDLSRFGTRRKKYRYEIFSCENLNIPAERTVEDKEASTKNELVRGKTGQIPGLYIVPS